MSQVEPYALEIRIAKCKNGFLANVVDIRSVTRDCERSVFESSDALFAWLREQFGEGEESQTDEPGACISMAPCKCSHPQAQHALEGFCCDDDLTTGQPCQCESFESAS